MFVGEGQNPTAVGRRAEEAWLQICAGQGMRMFHWCVMLWVHPPGTEQELNSGSSMACPGVRCCGFGVHVVMKET